MPLFCVIRDDMVRGFVEPPVDVIVAVVAAFFEEKHCCLMELVLNSIDKVAVSDEIEYSFHFVVDFFLLPNQLQDGKKCFS